MVGGLVVVKAVALVLAFIFAGISFSQQPQSEFPIHDVLNRYIEWCKQNWGQCREIRLRRLAIEKECLERSQSLSAFVECMSHLRKEKMRD